MPPAFSYNPGLSACGAILAMVLSLFGLTVGSPHRDGKQNGLQKPANWWDFMAMHVELDSNRRFLWIFDVSRGEKGWFASKTLRCSCNMKWDPREKGPKLHSKKVGRDPCFSIQFVISCHGLIHFLKETNGSSKQSTNFEESPFFLNTQSANIQTGFCMFFVARGSPVVAWPRCLGGQALNLMSWLPSLQRRPDPAGFVVVKNHGAFPCCWSCNPSTQAWLTSKQAANSPTMSLIKLSKAAHFVGMFFTEIGEQCFWWDAKPSLHRSRCGPPIRGSLCEWMEGWRRTLAVLLGSVQPVPPSCYLWGVSKGRESW